MKNNGDEGEAVARDDDGEVVVIPLMEYRALNDEIEQLNAKLSAFKLKIKQALDEEQ